jgi:hypothetical protein
MNVSLAQIETVLARIERLAEDLCLDPDELVRRSARELRAAFDLREAMEPAVARVRDSGHTLRDRRGSCALHPPTPAVEHLQQVLEQELVPNLRRIGFEV